MNEPCPECGAPMTVEDGLWYCAEEDAYHGEAEPEPESPVTCVCGYGPTTEEDLDEHVLASMHLPGDHIARR